MSKRYFPQQHGDRKKPKLDISRSDHNFPLSQNISENNKVSDQADTWGDENDDEILLLASQACEEAINDISLLPDYSMCMKPGQTSTQICDPSPSTSNFSFKKPTAIPNNIQTTDLKDKCNRISSPLPGISSKIIPNSKNDINLTDDFIFKQEPDHIYHQLLQLQEENAKLKSENGKLLEKCVTKEGEASILRTQLKSSQIAVDNVRMERIKAQERVQQEWTVKLQAANSQMHDLRTQLDFKNLEIISVKEKVRMLESSKVKLTQVMVGHNDISSSQHRRNSSILNESTLVPGKQKVPTSTCTAQTESAQMLKLNKIVAQEPNPLTPYLPTILEKTEETSRITLNEKLQPHADTHTAQCKVYSTFHRIPTAPVLTERRWTICLDSLHKTLTEISSGGVCESNLVEILKTAQSTLQQVHSELEQVSHKMTNAFQKEMDERYIEGSQDIIHVCDKDLIRGRPIFPEEQAILSRRTMALIPLILVQCVQSDLLNVVHSDLCLMNVVHRICSVLDNTSCAYLYSGLLSSITNLIHMTIKNKYKTTNKHKLIPQKNQKGSLQTTKNYKNMTNGNKKEENGQKCVEIIKCIISSRPMSFVTCQVLELLRELIADGCSVDQFCPGGVGANLRLDYDQGVLLYKKDSCLLQVFLKQIEATLRCIEKQSLCSKALEVTQNLLFLYSNANGIQNSDRENKCDCQLVVMQVIVYALRISAVMMTNVQGSQYSAALLAVCRSGIQPLYQCVLRDMEFSSRLGHNEGHLIEFCEIMRTLEHSDGISNMLSELSSAFQSSPEDTTTSYSRQPWITSFQTFSITD